jgi:hypothetical protein
LLLFLLLLLLLLLWVLLPDNIETFSNGSFVNFQSLPNQLKEVKTNVLLNQWI